MLENRAAKIETKWGQRLPCWMYSMRMPIQAIKTTAALKATDRAVTIMASTPNLKNTTAKMVAAIDIQNMRTPSAGLPVVPDFSEGSDLVAKYKKAP